MADPEKQMVVDGSDHEDMTRYVESGNLSVSRSYPLPSFLSLNISFNLSIGWVTVHHGMVVGISDIKH